MPEKLCNICLRVDIELLLLEGELSEYYEEICDLNIMFSEVYTCLICKELMKKCFDFRKLCLKSKSILKSWKTKKKKDKEKITSLHSLISDSYNLLLHDENKDSKIKNEIEAPLNTNNLLQENDTVIPKTEIEEINSTTQQENNKIDRVNSINDVIIDNDDITNNDDIANNDNLTNDVDMIDSDDDKLISEFITDVKINKKITKKTIKRKNVQKKDNEGSKEDSIWKRKRPLKEEYGTVFDIEIFKSEEECRRQFTERKYLDHYKNAKFKCDICYTVYKCQKLKDFHMKWHDPSTGDIICDICLMRFKTKHVMLSHRNDVHHGVFKCKMCPLMTYRKMVMILHYRKHKGYEYKCKYCEKDFRHSSSWMTHMRTAHRSGHTCGACARSFVSPAGLRQHKRMVHQMSTEQECQWSVKCEHCDMSFATQDVYMIHLLSTHRDLAKNIIACPECGKRFEDKISLRAHRRELHPSYNYHAMRPKKKFGNTCAVCGASGSFNSWLYQHFQEQHPELPYEAAVYDSDRRKHLCDQCGRSFTSITSLKEHSLLHSGSRPYSCSCCPASFRTAAHLKVHSERHAPPTRQCAVCSKKFVSASNLSNHMRIHIGDRRYKCSICDKGFLHANSLREHVQGVHLHLRRDRKNKGKD